MRIVSVFSLVSAVLLSACVASSLNAPMGSQVPSRLRYTRIYCTPDTETHFEDLTAELSQASVFPPAAPVYAGGNRQVSGALFVGANAYWGTDALRTHVNRPVAEPQLVVVLAGVWSVTTTDGETRQFSPGDVAWAEDTSPCKGHITVVGDKAGLLMITR